MSLSRNCAQILIFFTRNDVAMPLLECYNALPIGAWRSLVARFNGVEEVVSSNLAAPTRKRRNFSDVFAFKKGTACLSHLNYHP